MSYLLGLSNEAVIAVVAAIESVFGGESADVTKDESGTAVAKFSSASKLMFLIRKSMTHSPYKCCLTTSACTQHILAVHIKDHELSVLQSIVEGSTASSVQQLQDQETLSVKAAAHVADHANCLQLVYMMYHTNFAYHQAV